MTKSVPQVSPREQRTVFLSYSRKDSFFAELAKIKLAEAGIVLWQDLHNLKAGNDWQLGIEEGISGSIAVIVALSEHSVRSGFVTYEWAYALGQGKTVIPLKLNECSAHPKLRSRQNLDFSNPSSLQWDLLIHRINEIEVAQEEDKQSITSDSSENEISVEDNKYVQAILEYLNQRGYRMISFERIRDKIDSTLTDKYIADLIRRNYAIFRFARLKGNKPGLSKRFA